MIIPHSYESTDMFLDLRLYSHPHFILNAILHTEIIIYFDTTVAATKVIRLRELAYLKMSYFIFAES